jgi:hypothetical protein
MVDNNTMGRLMRGPAFRKGRVRCVKPNSQRPFISNIRTILPTEGTAHPSNGLFITTFFANFLELRHGEVRRIYLLGTSVNKGPKLLVPCLGPV